jgi:protein required for attachment to host cells
MAKSLMTKSVMKPRRKARIPQAPEMTSRRQRTLVVVADGAKARFLEPSDDHKKLVPTENADMLAPKARRPDRDLVTDKPGRGFSPARDGRRGRFDPPHDPHKMEKHNFAARLAETLDRACSAKKFDRLVLVAPKRSLGELRTLLSPRVKKAVSHEVAKDLTASSPTALRKALAGALPEPAVAASA